MSLADKLKSFMQQKENDNLKAGEEFLAENGKRVNVVTLLSGLQYEIITQGAGEKPTAYNTVTCHYHGTTIKGEVFDSSVKRGQPASFPLNAVIKGWTEALQLMPVGSKWKLFIPAHLAYGNRGVSREIGPNSTLIFEVELISFK
jgi:FKBP-type peptidyl-prolyl cis-trans isomerase FklB